MSDDAAAYPGLDKLTEDYDRKQMEFVHRAQQAQAALNLLGAGTPETHLQLSVRYGPSNPYGPKGTDQAALANAWAEGAQHGYALAMMLTQQAREAD